MTLDAPFEVTLDAATERDATVLANLLELYVYDMTEVFPGLELGTDGRFGYRELSRYWSEPGRRFAFLVRQDARLSGFILVTRGSPVSKDPEVFDIAEFFVLRGRRRSGVGRSAARLLWSRFPGRWTVRVSEGNLRALPFWSGIIGEHSGGRAIQSLHPGSPHAWRVFSFETRAQDGSAIG
jgi:predicted acetyltransferase